MAPPDLNPGHGLPQEAEDHGRRGVYRRTLTVVIVSQVLAGAGLAAGVAVGALLAEQMLGGEALAGLPSALFTLGSALAAFLVGSTAQRMGRRRGLAAGFLAGGLGSIGVVVAAATGNIVLLFASLFVYGSGSATSLQARYAAADAALPRERAKAVSAALVSTTLGAVAGPNLVSPLGRFAELVGLPALAGPFLLSAVAYLTAGLVIHLLLRPDPLLFAKRFDAWDHPTSQAEEQARRPRLRLVAGVSTMVLSQLAMVAIMTMTPVHMARHGHGLTEVGFVIGLHIAAMFLPSPLSGLLADRLGRIPVAMAGGVTLLASGIVAAYAPGGSLGWTVLALVLLGLGWNLGLVSGSALVVDATTVANRARVQGTNDVLVALAGATGGATSGVLMSAAGFQGLALVSGLVAGILVPLIALRSR